MDLTQTIIAKSDQLNADDLLSGPRTFTVTEVRQGDAEQPVSIVLAEWPSNRPFKPSKTVTRILVHAWGKETDEWPQGARMTLFRDADVKWAGQAIGGIRVSHLSHIKGKLKIALQESKGKKTLHTIDPLPDAAPEPTPDELAAQVVSALADATTADDAREWGNRAHARNLLDVQVDGTTVRDHVTARLAALTEEPA
tara:strand:+ start:8852 stop:9442 length:591 start_codon:yes stop_codon:yes gene_type:complete